MDWRQQRMPPSTASSLPSTSNNNPPQQSLLRSSVSMFIEDSRITAVANAEPPPVTSASTPTRRPSYFSVTSYTSSSSTSAALPGGVGVASAPSSPSGYLRPSFCQFSTSLPDQPQQRQQPPLRPRACSSSPVRFPGREFIHSIIREDEELMSGSSGGGGGGRGRRQPPPPASTVRRRSTLSVEPTMSFLSVKEALPTVREDRAYTSVNLTLRTPSMGGGGGGGGGGSVISGGGGMNVVNTVNVNLGDGGTTFRHVHHRHPAGGCGDANAEGDEEGACGGVPASSETNLMYSSYSNGRDGFEAQVQIQFGPNGGTFTASRRRNGGLGGIGVGVGGDQRVEGGLQQERFQLRHRQHNISIRQQMSTDLLSAQTERKDKLRSAIHDRRGYLAKLQAEIGQLRSQLELRGSFSELEHLKQENQRLRIECNFMSREVDIYQNGNMPLGETNEEFYQSLNPGQSINALFGITNNRRKVGGPGGQPPPRPPPPRFLNSPGTPTGGSTGGTPTGGVDMAGSMGGHVGGGGQGGFRKEEMPEDGEWICSMCTFQNHRDLDFCEQCLMVRVKQAHHQQLVNPHHHQYQQQHHGPSGGGGGREQNIRIRVRRHHHRRPHHHFDDDGEDDESKPRRGENEEDEEGETQRRRLNRQQQRRVIHSWVL